MRRLVPLLGAVLALALSGTAAADTFSVVKPHKSGGQVRFSARQASKAIPFTAMQSEPMSFASLRGIWQAAGATYGIPWEVLAAINKVESDFGRNLGPSSAGAIGWMQFMPSTWARWGVDANGDGVADPNNPVDAIFSAARYLAGCGGQTDISAAIYCYNHANWYVNDVLSLAAQYGRSGDVGGGLLPLNPLGDQVSTARQRIATAKSKIASARAHAGALARKERRFLHVVDITPSLAAQLTARKQAVLLGLRRDALLARIEKLRGRLRTATRQLERASSSLAAPSYLFPVGAAFLPTGQNNPVVSTAMRYLGIPYRWAGADPATGFDCSGLVQYVFSQLGVSLPHNTVAQWNSPQAVPVPRNDLQPGDLVFFNGLDHVGIYVGNGYIIDAPHTGSFVRVDSLDEPWFANRYDGARRIDGAAGSYQGGSGGAVSFTTTGDGTAFTPNVVYFTR
jgi:cell wall-associated NlpC family hydrolase